MSSYYFNKCRVCLGKDIKFYPLNGEIPNVDTKISTMITYCTSMELEPDEDLPQGVCIPCFKTIRISYNFIKKYKETRQKLLQEAEKIRQEQLVKIEEQCLNDLKEEDVNIFQTFEGADNFNSIEVVREETIPATTSESIQIIQIANDDNLKKSVRIIPLRTELPSPIVGSVNLENSTTRLILTPIVPTVVQGASSLVNKVPIPRIVGKRSITSNKKQNKTVIKQKTMENKTNIQTRNSKTLLYCPKCPGVFYKEFEKGFVPHILAYHKEESIKCTLCPINSLKYEEYLRHFFETHRFQCHVCSKSFRCLSSKNAHLRVHSMVRYKCNYENCSRSFVTAWYLKKHINTHTKDVKFTCTQCGYKTCTYDNFQYHRKKHKDRKYLCTYCGQNFILAVHLKYHMWKHTGDKYFKCKLCPKSYTSSSQLKKHRQRHHGGAQ